MRPSLPGLLGLAILLIGTIALEFANGARDDDRLSTNAALQLPTMPEPVAAIPVPNERRPTPVEGILARPLFAAARRPTAALAAPTPPPVSLPRLTAILVNGGSRSAIFAVAGEARPLVVHEGARVGDHVVQSIEASQVTLSGPSMPQIVRPTFDPRPQGSASGMAAAEPAAKDAATLASALDILQRRRDSPGISGEAAR